MKDDEGGPSGCHRRDGSRPDGRPGRSASLRHAGGGLVYVGLAAVALGLPSGPVAGQLKSEQCLAQLRDETRESVSCALTAGAGERLKKRLTKETQGVVTDATCRVPMRMEKKAFRAAVAAGGDVALPELKVTCEITGAGGADGAARASAVLRPTCKRVEADAAGQTRDAPSKDADDKDADDKGAKGGDEADPKKQAEKLPWSCEPNVSDLEGLGMLGVLFQRLANTSDTVRYAMAKFMTDVEKALADPGAPKDDTRKGETERPDEKKAGVE